MRAATTSDGAFAAASLVLAATTALQPAVIRPQSMPWRSFDARHSILKLSNVAPSRSSNYASSCARPFGPSWHHYGELTCSGMLTWPSPCFAGSFTLGRHIYFSKPALCLLLTPSHLPFPYGSAESWLSSAAVFTTVTALSPSITTTTASIATAIAFTSTVLTASAHQ